jgi:hypothetical protein
MKGELLWEQYQEYTKDVTEQGRKLGFGGVAICWLFKLDDFTFPILIYWALVFLIAFFITDLLQPFIGSLILRFFTQNQEAKAWRDTNSIEGEILKPRWVDRPAFIIFFVKVGSLFCGYGVIGLYLFDKLF